MLEIVVIAGMCIVMAKIADAEDRSGIIWGSLTLLLCLGSLAVPFPFLRVLGAGVAAFVLMFVSKAIFDR